MISLHTQLFIGSTEKIRKKTIKLTTSIYCYAWKWNAYLKSGTGNGTFELGRGTSRTTADTMEKI
jgi:hypothetical protein